MQDRNSGLRIMVNDSSGRLSGRSKSTVESSKGAGRPFGAARSASFVAVGEVLALLCWSVSAIDTCLHRINRYCCRWLLIVVSRQERDGVVVMVIGGKHRSRVVVIKVMQRLV